LHQNWNKAKFDLSVSSANPNTMTRDSDATAWLNVKDATGSDSVFSFQHEILEIYGFPLA